MSPISFGKNYSLNIDIMNDSVSRNSTYQTNTWFPGPSFSNTKIPSGVECRNLCIDTPDCNVWTWNPDNKDCELKNLYEPSQPSDLMISGFVANREPNVASANNTHMHNTTITNASRLDNRTNNRFNNNRPPPNIPVEPFYVSGKSLDMMPNTMFPYDGEYLEDPIRISGKTNSTVCPEDTFSRTWREDKASCQDRCVRDPNCLAWSFDKIERRCDLGNKIANCQPIRGIDSGEINTITSTDLNGSRIKLGKSNRSPNFLQISTRMDNTNCPEFPDRRKIGTAGFYTSNPLACRDRCLEEPNCNLWSYDENQRECFLRDGNEQCTSTSGYTSGRILSVDPNSIQQPAVPPISSDQTSTPGSSYPSWLPPGYYQLTTKIDGVSCIDDISRPNPPNNSRTSEECINKCQNTYGCNSWSYDKDNQRCYLQQGNGRCINNPSYISGQILTFNTRKSDYDSPNIQDNLVPKSTNTSSSHCMSNIHSNNTFYPDQSMPYELPDIARPDFQLPTKINVPVKHVSFRPTENTKFIRVSDAEKCKDLCMSLPNCSQWNFSNIADNPTCAIIHTAPQIVYKNPDAQGGRIYSIQKYPSELSLGRTQIPQSGLRR